MIDAHGKLTNRYSHQIVLPPDVPVPGLLPQILSSRRHYKLIRTKVLPLQKIILALLKVLPEKIYSDLSGLPELVLFSHLCLWGIKFKMLYTRLRIDLEMFGLYVLGYTVQSIQTCLGR